MNVKGIKKYELVPPDGGWGYMIFIAFIINISTTMSFMGCFGMLYNDFMKEIGMESAGVTLLTGIGAICYAVSGFLASPLLKIMSMRKLGLVAAIAYDLGLLGMVFANSQGPFFLCQGIMQGVGVGVLYNLSCTIMNDYFVKKRMFAVSFVQTVVAINAMVAPMFVKWSLEHYGYRGTLLLLSAISLHNLLGVVLMQPVEWHMKRVEVITEINHDIKPLLLNEKVKTDESGNFPTIKLNDVEEGASTTNTSMENVFDDSSQNTKSSAFRKLIGAFLDVSLCKTFLLSCTCLGPALCMFADSTYTIILPQALYSVGWNPGLVAWALSLMAFGDLAMRATLIFASKWLLKIGSQEVYIIGVALAFVSRLGMLWSENSIAILTYITLMGAARAVTFVLIAVVISEVVSIEQFSLAMGMFMMLLGLVVLILGPAIGAVRDLTNSYSTAFYILTSFFAIVIMFWTIELCYKKNKERRILQKVNPEKSSQTTKGK